VHRGDQAQVLTSGTIDFECLKEATNISLATMLRIEGADMLVKLKFSMNACGLSNFSGANFYGYKAVSLFKMSAVYEARLESITYFTFRQSQTVEYAPYPSFPTTLYLESNISPMRTG